MAMNKQRRTANLNNIVTYDTLKNVTLLADLTIEGLTGAGFVKADANGLLSVDTGAYLPIPSQTGNSGKFLSTDGSVLSWQSVPQDVNIYNNDGTLTGNRELTTGGNYLQFKGTSTSVDLRAYSTLSTGSSTMTFYSNTWPYGFKIGMYSNSFGSGMNDKASIHTMSKDLYFTQSGSATPSSADITMAMFQSTKNITIGGTTDAGYKLDVQGTGRITGITTLGPVASGNFLQTQASTATWFSDGNNPLRIVRTFALLNLDNNGTLTLGSHLNVQKIFSSLNQDSGGTGIYTASITAVVSGTNRNMTNQNRQVLQLTSTGAGSVINAPKLSFLDISRGDATGFTSYVGIDVIDCEVRLNSTSGSTIVGGSSINASAKLQVDSVTSGFLPPRMTNAQRTAISTPATGLMAYSTDATEGMYLNLSGGWQRLLTSGDTIANIYNSDGTLTGNRTISTTSGYTLTINPSTSFISSTTINAGLSYSEKAYRYVSPLGNVTAIGYVSTGLTSGSTTAHGIRLLDPGYGSFYTYGTLYPGIYAGLTGAEQTVINSYNSLGLYSYGSLRAIIKMHDGIDLIMSTVAGAGIQWGTNSGGNISAAGKIFQTGNITIGGTTDAGYKLDVQGTLRANGNITLQSGSQKQILFDGQGVKLFHNANALGNNIVIGWSGETIANDSTTQRSTIIGFHNRGDIPSQSQIFGNSNNLTGYTGSTVHIYGSNIQLNSTSESGGYYYGSDGIIKGAFKGLFASDFGNAELPPLGVNAGIIIGTGVNNQNIDTPSIYLGQWGSDDGMPTNARNVFISTTNGVGTDIEGYNLVLSSGRSTGAATSKDIIFATSTATTSGTSLQSFTRRWWIKGGSGALSNVSSPTSGYVIDARGLSRFESALTYSSGIAVQAATATSNITFAAGASISSGSHVGSFVSSGTNTFNGNITIPNSAIASSQLLVNRVYLNSTGMTVTMTQGTTGIRALAGQVQVVQFDDASTTGTVSHMAGIQFLAPYKATGNQVTVTNYYGIAINPSDEYSTQVAVTNRWGIYQVGASDNNYFAGKVLIGTNTVGTYALDVTGTGRFTGALTAGTNSSIGGISFVGSDSVDFSSSISFRYGGNVRINVSSTNTSIGHGTGLVMTLNNNSISIGETGGISSTGGKIMLGQYAGYSSSTNGDFVAIGAASFFSTTNPTNGIAIGGRNAGAGALRGNTGNHTNCFFFGSNTGASTNSVSLSNTYIIGNDVRTDLSNVFMLGKSDQTIMVGEGTSVGSGAIFQIDSTTKGFLPPRMTGAQAEAIGTPAAGLLVYANNGNGTTITTTGWWGYNGTTWVKLN